MDEAFLHHSALRVERDRLIAGGDQPREIDLRG
jgi:hypothetical protein